MKFCTDIIQENIREQHTEANELLQIKDWPNLAINSQSMLLRSIQERMAIFQGIAQTTINNQTELASGLRQALEEFQATTGNVLGELPEGISLPPVIRDFLNKAGNIPVTATTTTAATAEKTTKATKTATATKSTKKTRK